MTENNSSPHEEARLAALLRSTEADVAPDETMLASLRQKTQDLFAESRETVPINAPPPRRFSIVWRSLAALAASVVVLIVWLGLSSSGAAVPFSQVLADLQNATTLQLRVTREGKSADVWVRSPAEVRIDETPSRYRIASGSRLWRIDEAANTAKKETAPWFEASQQHVDLLELLEFGVTDSAPLRTAQPTAERREYGGRKCIVYRANVPSRQGQLAIEAYTDAASGRLAGIVAWPAGGAPHAGVPLAELQLLAVDAPVDESKFVVARSLTEDGAIGKVSDAQGIVLLRPALVERWTPVCREVLLKPGDWLRTDLRGANAAKVRLTSDTELTLGPGTLIECIAPAQARLHTGEIQVRLPGKKPAPFELLAPRQGSQKYAAAGKQVWRVDRDEKLAAVKVQPRWLAGFEGTSAAEALGSLIVKLPDGRNEPLSIGYHKVSVEIRDQIARTTIEESFVNHTDARLEGVFHFPLPQEASISGFGMWIGSELIEADVVEKQRAREIYETILRENRDPGLLEWTGGNLFKARVFPIEAHAEKQVKIVYTQVLPLRGNSYRYSYGLQSEMLRTKPLRELSLSVTVSSALPLKGVTCPTHSARTQQTAHAAQVDFAAQEYTPDRDFDVVCEVDGRGSDVVVVPHRRGSDGYFLVQLMPPAQEGNWEREIVPDGVAQTLVLLCDTSGSIGPQQRKQQAEFVSVLLQSLTDMDRFLLAATDVETVWASPEPQPAKAENISQARAFLENRWSLGWTDLRRAFAAVLKKAPPGAHIIYVGDGIASTGETDPASFVKELERLVAAAKPAAGEAPTLHAVGVGNTFETMVLQGIATAGRGSVRMLGGEQTPSANALELLREITRPGLRDLKVEFRGLEVAAVYPERLPPLPTGTQQILVGRYLPPGKGQGEGKPESQSGEIVVTGKRGQETVCYAAKINLRDDEQGNSFIPRLWARAHMDHLLNQGTSDAIRDQIIGLSEEFHIITPYTSLLVLETDADRERFRVKRRFEMRDGQQFFAKGRNDANYALRQQQIAKAGDWRVGLRRQVLQSLSGLGRPSLAMPSHLSLMTENTRVFTHGSVRTLAGGQTMWGGEPEGTGMALLPFLGVGFRDSRRVLVRDDSESMQPLPSRGRFTTQSEIDLPILYPEPAEWDELSLGRGENLGDWDIKTKKGQYTFTVAKPIYETKTRQWDTSSPAPSGEHAFADGEGEDASRQSDFKSSLAALDATLEMSEDGRKAFMPEGYFDSDKIDKGITTVKEWEFGLLATGFDRLTRDAAWKSPYSQHVASAWSNQLFPQLDGPRRPTIVKVDPNNWPPEAVALSKSLLRTEALRKLSGGVELRSVTEQFDPVWRNRLWQRSDLVLYGPQAWLTRTNSPQQQTLVDYCEGQERGVYSLAFLLGRTRKAHPSDFQAVPTALEDAAPLHEAYAARQARTEPAGKDQVRLVIANTDSQLETRYLIDTARHVVLNVETRSNGELDWTSTLDDFVQIGSAWWARHSVTTDAKGRKATESRHTFVILEPRPFAERIKEELKMRTQVQFLSATLPSLAKARGRAADGSADFNDRLRLALHFDGLQQWTEMLVQLAAAEKLAADKHGVRWLRTLALSAARRHDEARQRLLTEVKQLAAGPQQDDFFLADFVLSQYRAIASYTEQLALIEQLKPVRDRQPAERSIWWFEARLNACESLAQYDDVLALRRTLAEAQPWATYRQVQYARQLQQAGQSAAAYAWLQKQLDRPVDRDANDIQGLRTAIADLYRGEARWEDLLKYITAWIAGGPPDETVYLQHLSALVYNNQLAAAEALARQWLKEGSEGQLNAAQRGRLDAAVRFMGGSGYNLSLQRMDDRWHEPLADVARACANKPDRLPVVQTIMQSLSDTEAGDRLRGHLLGLLSSDAATLTPQQISSYVNWTLQGRIELAEPLAGRKQFAATEIPGKTWETIAAALRTRWSATKNPQQRHALGETLRTIYAQRFADTLLLPFLRERIDQAPQLYRGGYVADLIQTLASGRWTDDAEREAFEWLRKLSDESDPIDRLPGEAAALQQLVDQMVTARVANANQKLRDEGKVKELTRTELFKKREESLRAARQGVADRLRALAADDHTPLAPWLRMEQARLDVQLDRDLPQVESQCWEILGKEPLRAVEEPAPDVTDTQLRKQVFDGVLRQRAWALVMNLAARRDAKPAARDRVLQYTEAGIAQGGETAIFWQNARFQMLIALDRPDDLERDLRGWIRGDASVSPWRTMLALLLAERGRLDEAIQLFERAGRDQMLTAGDYRTLSDWYLASDRRADYEQARVSSYKLLPENLLGNRLYGLYSRWNGNVTPPSSIDDDTLLALRALFEKSERPENYIWHLQNLYGASRDFRVLRVLPDAVVGRTPQQIYTFLGTLRPTPTEVRSEAPADEIVARIAEIRKQKPSATDQRALDLLEVMVECRCAEVLNQPGPHVEKGLAAMKSAFAHPWNEGEPPLMAEFLTRLGKLPHASLVSEQLRELRALQALLPAGSPQRLRVADELTNLMFWSYNQQDAAIETMQAEVNAFEAKHNGVWSPATRQHLSRYVDLLEGAQRFAAGEAVLQKALARADNDDARAWLQDRMLSLYRNTLNSGGEVSLGKEAGLLRALADHCHKLLKSAANEKDRSAIVSQWISILSIAHGRHLPGVADLVRDLAMKTMPEVLKRLTDTYGNTVRGPVWLIRETLGPKMALAYVVERMEQYPEWLEVSWNNSFNHLGYDLARYRSEAAEATEPLGDLERRTLTLVLGELRRELRSGSARGGSVYNKNASYFWKEKQGAFLDVANEMYAERKTSGRRVMFVSAYLRDGLGAEDRAIEILLAAHGNGVLDQPGQDKLIGYLHTKKRFAESIPLLEPRLQTTPEAIRVRVQLMTAYFQSKRNEQLVELLKQTDAYFHQADRWQYSIAAELGEATLACDLPKEAVAYLTEAIALLQKSRAGLAPNPAALSDLNRHLALAHSSLGQTREAVDAASAAIVAWGPQANQRSEALGALLQVLEQSKDLPAFVRHLDQQAAQSGQDSPILRKALGLVYQVRGDHNAAISQFELAVRLQPNDRQTHEALVASLDAVGKKTEATTQLLRQIDEDRRNLPLYEKLAERLKDNPAEAERAVTSIVEVAPQESENHTALADLRQKQGRWEDAIPHWERVAALRKLEPTGLLKLAEAQIHEKQWPAARKTLARLQKTEWPTRFGDVNETIRKLNDQLPR